MIVELRPKAEALDRLEEFTQVIEGGLVWAWRTTEGYKAEFKDPDGPTDFGFGPDLASAINAAFEQWKGEP
jgi:hypothetical protein